MNAPTLTPEQHASFAEDGYLILRDILSPEETKALQQWAQQVHDYPINDSVPYMPYVEVNDQGKRVLCRTEVWSENTPPFSPPNLTLAELRKHPPRL